MSVDCRDWYTEGTTDPPSGFAGPGALAWMPEPIDDDAARRLGCRRRGA